MPLNVEISQAFPEGRDAREETHSTGYLSLRGGAKHQRSSLESLPNVRLHASRAGRPIECYEIASPASRVRNDTRRYSTCNQRTKYVRRPVSRILSAPSPWERSGTVIDLGAASQQRSCSLPAGQVERAVPSRLFGLAPDGVYHAADRYRQRGGLLPHRFTLACASREAIGGLFSAALSVASRRPAVSRHPALRSSDFPPPRKLERATVRPPHVRCKTCANSNVLIESPVAMGSGDTDHDSPETPVASSDSRSRCSASGRSSTPQDSQRMMSSILRISA